MPIAPPKFVARVNYKSLAASEILERLSSEKVLREVRKEILKGIQDRIKDAAFSPRAKKALVLGLKTKVGPRSLTLIATHPAFLPLVKGMESRQMKWLRKSPTAIPIVLDDGKVIFRAASAKSMRDGKWIHPGHKPTNIIDLARKEARSIIKSRLKEDLLRQFREGLR